MSQAPQSQSSHATSTTPPPNIHSAFSWQRSQRIESLNLLVEEYIHNETGAQHIHISTDNNENVFLVALRTVPEDSTGVAHILEHTALCGSEKYPVRDPFFMMIRRSLNTFMNAFTSSDWTAYPFASQNKKDFNNLLDVYLDAVFFSRLDPLDFAQEGHRIEFEEPSNPESNLVYKGVVFNEMKGAMSSTTSILWQNLSKYLFPATTYHYNSGGDPECIPDLSYEQLVHFYKTHYHPSNAIFMTFGDIPAIEHQEKFEQQALSRFEKLDEVIAVPNEKRYHAPLRIEEAYPCETQGEETLDNKTHIVMGWLLGDSTNLTEVLEAQLLSEVLLENSACPLQHALESTSLGNAPSPLCGLEDSQKELIFVCGLEGSNVDTSREVEQLILDAIAEVANNGASAERLEACLHQLELQQREIGGDGYPYGLQLILTVLNSATHRGDPIALLDLDTALEDLRTKIKDPEFIKQLAHKLLLDNPHRVCLTLRPDDTLAGKRVTAEQQQLAAIKARLTDTEKQQVIEQTLALEARQQAKDDESILPSVSLEDIPEDIHIPSAAEKEAAPLPVDFFAVGTNGLVYQQIIITLPQLNEDEQKLLPIYNSCLTELGIGERDYLATQNWQSEVCGSIHTYSSVRSHIDNVQQVSGHVVLSSKALERNHAALCDLMQQTLEDVRFDEHNRIRDLVAQLRARREMSVTGSGHTLAMTAASSAISPLARYSHQISGLAGIKTLKEIDTRLQEEPQAIEALASRLQNLHQKILAMPRQCLLVADGHHQNNLTAQFNKQWQQYQYPDNPPAAFSLPAINGQVSDFWQTNTQVNFCAKAYATVGSSHPDAPALNVLGGFLRNGFLHTAIREQGGAYGGGAGQDNNIGAFRFFSYRDPRFGETLNDFDRSIDWLLNEKHEWRQVEEAILGVISGIDKPSSPAGEAKIAYHNNLYGRGAAQRKAFRQAVLQVTLEDLQRVGKQYLTDHASTAVISYAGNSDAAAEHQLDIIVL